MIYKKKLPACVTCGQIHTIRVPLDYGIAEITHDMRGGFEGKIQSCEIQIIGRGSGGEFIQHTSEYEITPNTVIVKIKMPEMPDYAYIRTYMNTSVKSQNRISQAFNLTKRRN